MPSNSILEKKQQIVADLAAQIKESAAGVIVNYQGITVDTDTAMRKELRTAGVKYVVSKNTLTGRACDEVGYGALKEHLNGMTAIAISKDDPVAAAKILKKYARYEILVLDEWLTEDVNDVDISFLFELIDRRYAARSTVLCTQYAPAEWHGRLGGGVQADAMVDRLVHGAVRIDLGDVNVRRLLAEKK